MSSPMRTVSLRNLAAHKVRLVLTVLSVVLGTAFITGSFVFTDTLQKTFDGIFADVAEGVDVRVSPEEMQSSGVPLDDVGKIAALDGVRAVAAAATGFVVLLDGAGDVVKTGGAPSIGAAYLPPDRAIAEPQTFVSGRAPQSPGEVALNEGAAVKAGVHVGDALKVVVPTRGLTPIDVSLVGIYETDTDTGGYVGVLFDEAQARTLFTDGSHVAYVDVAGTSAVAPDTLRERIAELVPDMSVQDGAEVRADAQSDIEDALSFFNYFLLAFGAIALLVGTFIIYNTFTMIVAQRLRELALLRAVGASRAQVGRSVVLEAFVVGIVGSVVGLAAGVGLAYGLRGLLNGFDVGLPTGELAFEPRTVLVAFGVGIGVTVISAYAPARRAAKIPPVEAMREEFASTGDTLRVRTAVGAALGAAGIATVILGAQSTGGSAAATVGVGALALILAVLLAAPALSRPVVGGLGVAALPFGSVGRLARNNAVRNPRRTAATAFALTLGLMLVSAIAMFGTSAKASIDTLVDKGVEADFVLTGPQGIGVPVGAAQAVRSVPGVADAVSLHFVLAKVDDEAAGNGVAFSGPIEPVLAVTMLDGSADLPDDGILVSESESSDKGWRMGDIVRLASYDGAEFPVTVTGIYENSQVLGDWVVSELAYQELSAQPPPPDFMVLVKAAPGTDLAALRSGLEKAVEPSKIVDVMDREQFKGEQGRQIDTLLAVLYGLLALAIVIAILGIVNTLALSVVERRREIGMLRAIGMSRAQVRRTIYLESMLIAVFGAVVGVLLGLGLGAGFIRTLRDEGLGVIAYPWAQVALMLIGSAIGGVLAAVWPAVRAARTRPLEAIEDV